MALELIKISDFPQVSDPKEWLVVSDESGTGYKISKQDFKDWLGTVTVSTPKPIGPSDVTPELDGVYIPTVVGVYPNFGGLERLESDGYVQFIKNGAVYAKVNTPLPKAENKIPLYSSIKNAGIVAGSQFIDDENGYIQYQVKAGQILNEGELPADNVDKKVLQLTEGLEPTNLYNPATDKADSRLDINTGNSVAEIGSKHSQPMNISPHKRYIMGRFPQVIDSPARPLRMVVFYKQSGVRMTQSETGWGGTYYINTSVGDTGFKKDYFELVPLADIPPDWKTNGGNQLPIPVEARSLAINTVYGEYSLQETFSLTEKRFFNKFTKFREKRLDYYDDALYNLFNKITVPNYFSYATIRQRRAMNVKFGSQYGQPDIDGFQYMTSDYINVSEFDVWYLQGRNTTEEGNTTSRAFVWYDKDLNLLPLVDKNGVELGGPEPFAMPYQNGVVYKPANAKYAMFQALFKSTIALSPSIMFTPYTEKVEQYVSFGNYLVNTSFMFNNSSVEDGKIMVKDGDSFTGMDALPNTSSKNDYDGIFRIINFLATAINKTQQLQFEHVNILPNTPEPSIVWHDNKLKLVQNGIAKEFNLI